MSHEFQKEYNKFTNQYDSDNYIKDGFKFFERVFVYGFLCLFIGWIAFIFSRPKSIKYFYDPDCYSFWIFFITIPSILLLLTIVHDYKRYQIAMQYKEELDIINKLFQSVGFDEQKSLNLLNQFSDFESNFKQNFKLALNDYPFIENSKVQFCFKCGKRKSISFVHRDGYRYGVWFSRCLSCKKYELH